MFARRDRAWAALIMPALAVAIVVTFTRSATIGACAAAAVLFSMKDRRLLAVLPIVVAMFFAIAPAKLTARYVSTFNLHDPTNRDRLAMLREGAHMVRTHPLVGVGPNMVQRVYAEYRDPDAVEAYLRRSVVNLCRKHWRRMSRERSFLRREGPVIASRTTALPDVARRDALAGALDRLPYRQRAALVLRFYEDLTERQTARALGCAVGTVKSLVFRGLQALREEIGHDDED